MEPWDYVDAAVKRGPAGNDTEVADLVGVNKSTVSFWRSGRSKPRWDQLQRLARLAGVTEDEAYIDYAAWNGAPPSIGAKLKKALKVAGPMLLLLLLFSYADSHSNAVLAVTSIAHDCILWIVTLLILAGVSAVRPLGIVGSLHVVKSRCYRPSFTPYA